MYAEAQKVRDYGAIGAGSAANCAQDVGSRELEVPAGLERLDRQIGGLAEFVQTLDDRLTGRVARPQMPSPEGKGGQLKAATQCSIGGHLDALGDHVAGLRDRLGSLIDRLEV